MPQALKDTLELRLKLHDFLLCVAQGKQNSAETILKNSVNAQQFLTTAGTFTDYSGRTFHCTAYEYSYWAMDTHMRRMLKQHMDADTKALMSAHVEEIEHSGLAYSQNGQEFRSPHFDLGPLKTALKDYVDGYSGWDVANNYDALRAAWMNVGLFTAPCPSACSSRILEKRPFISPCPAFNEETLPRDVAFLIMIPWMMILPKNILRYDAFS